MRVRIHRGAEEIGGNCIELEAEGRRILLDLGRPLDAGWDEEVALPQVRGLADGGDPSLLGVLVSHPHLDHWGLVPRAAPGVPVYMGEAAGRILREAAFFSRAGADLQAAGWLRDRQPFDLGPFRVTPWLMDHSAFDAYALLVEAGGRRLFYTGDFRAHGRKAALFGRLLRDPPRGIDLLLVEATNLRPEGEQCAEELSETDVERRCVETFRATPGMALACYSAQNVDRLVTLYKAALQSDRDLVVDLYTATVAQATGARIPRPGPEWPRVKLYVPQRQRLQVKRSGEFGRVDALARFRIYPEQLAARRERLVTTFRPSMAADLERAGCLEGASVLWSLWSGYLAGDERLRSFLDRHRLPLVVHHSSGHAHRADLARLVDAIGARAVVPVHTTAARRFVDRHPAARARANGEWFEARA